MLTRTLLKISRRYIALVVVVTLKIPFKGRRTKLLVPAYHL